MKTNYSFVRAPPFLPFILNIIHKSFHFQQRKFSHILTLMSHSVFCLCICHICVLRRRGGGMRAYMDTSPCIYAITSQIYLYNSNLCCIIIYFYSFISVLSVTREDYHCGCHYPFTRRSSDGEILSWDSDCPEVKITWRAKKKNERESNRL